MNAIVSKKQKELRQFLAGHFNGTQVEIKIQNGFNIIFYISIGFHQVNENGVFKAGPFFRFRNFKAVVYIRIFGDTSGEFDEILLEFFSRLIRIPQMTRAPALMSGLRGMPFSYSN